MLRHRGQVSCWLTQVLMHSLWQICPHYNFMALSQLKGSRHIEHILLSLTTYEFLRRLQESLAFRSPPSRTGWCSKGSCSTNLPRILIILTHIDIKQPMKTNQQSAAQPMMMQQDMMTLRQKSSQSYWHCVLVQQLLPSMQQMLGDAQNGAQSVPQILVQGQASGIRARFYYLRSEVKPVPQMSPPIIAAQRKKQTGMDILLERSSLQDAWTILKQQSEVMHNISTACIWMIDIYQVVYYYY